MTILAADVIEKFYLFLWPMLRISAMLMLAPPFSQNAFNLRLRILIALVLTWLIFPHYQWPQLDPLSAAGLAEIFNQIFIGLTMGVVLQVVVAALVVAGQSISAAMGLAMANMIDPNVGNVPVLSQFLLVLSTLIFVGFGGHAMLLGLVLESFEALPIGTSILNQDVFGQVIRWSSMMFLGGLLLALPVMVMFTVHDDAIADAHFAAVQIDAVCAGGWLESDSQHARREFRPRMSGAILP